MQLSVVLGIIVAIIVVAGGIYTLTKKFVKPKNPNPPGNPPSGPVGGGTFKP